MKSAILFVSAGLVASSAAMADMATVTVAGSSVIGGFTYAAETTFTFDDVANTVCIHISNTMPAGSGAPVTDLSAIFWTFTNAPALDLMAPGMNGSFGSSANGGIVNTEGATPEQMWAFHDPSNAWSAPGGATQGLSAAGLGLFGPADFLATGGPDNSPDGFGGTIIPSAGDAHSGQPHQQFLNYVEFCFDVDSSFFANGIHNIGVGDASAQWDTTIDGPNVGLSVVPLPPAAWAGLAALASTFGVGYLRRRSFRS